MINEIELINLYLEEIDNAIQRAEERYNIDPEHPSGRDAKRVNSSTPTAPPLDRALRIAVIKYSEKTPY